MLYLGCTLKMANTKLNTFISIQIYHSQILFNNFN